MRVVLQRVSEASVTVDGNRISSVGPGFLLLVGVGKGDDDATAERMAGKISRLRVFEDARGKMNLDVSRVNGEALSVPQFTLLGSTEKGNRPGFDGAADPAEAERLWKRFNDALKEAGITVKEGEFGARMEVSLVNDGPVTFVLDSE